jgi:hypothetical protein
MRRDVALDPSDRVARLEVLLLYILSEQQTAAIARRHNASGEGLEERVFSGHGNLVNAEVSTLQIGARRSVTLFSLLEAFRLPRVGWQEG